MRIIVAEDEPVQARAIRMYLQKVNFELVALVDNAEDFLEAARIHEADVALIDVFINGKHDGIELAAQLREEQLPLAIIFLTSVKDESVFERARRVSTEGFLLKPFDKLMLKRHIQLAFDQFVAKQEVEEEDSVNFTPKSQSFLIRTGDTLQKVKVEDIQVLEAEKKYIRLTTTKGVFRIRTSLQNFLYDLPQDIFFKVHRSVVVNLEGFQNLNLKTKTLWVYEKEYALSRSAYEELLKRFPSYK